MGREPNVASATANLSRKRSGLPSTATALLPAELTTTIKAVYSVRVRDQGEARIAMPAELKVTDSGIYRYKDAQSQCVLQ